MKVAVYIRVSRRDLNPQNQLYVLMQHVNQKGWDYEVFEEIESTRKTRPVKQQLMQKLRAKRFKALLIYKLDRWARSLQELIMDIDELTNKGVEFIVLTQPIDTSSAQGRLFLQILAAFAEFEREIIRERTIAGLDRARAQGKKLGRPRKSEIKKRIKVLQKQI
jgi:putative DNA-invertase from lambdoid prophage Rac